MPEEFWYRMTYGGRDLLDNSRRSVGDDCPAPLQGEFWLTKEAVDKRNVYFQCSSTLAQAATMCIIFRFSCPTDFLSLIETQASALLHDLHIPTNGVVLGVEQDPRHAGLFRAFIEHRNEILDDIVVCECSPSELARTVVHQEVYDSGDVISYRLTLSFANGVRQQVCLQLPTERAEVDDRMVEDPSTRWPISPCVSRQLLSPANRIFVYSSVPSGLEDVESDGAPEEEFSASAFETPIISSTDVRDWGNMSEGTVEDWQSVGGGGSDAEADHACSSSPAKAVATVPAAVEWPRPVVDSVLLMCGVEEAPFKCLPASMP